MAVHLGAVGVTITIDMGETISTSTSYSLRVRKPSGNIVTWTPSISGTTALAYDTTAGAINEAGTYYINPYLTLSGWTGYCDAVKLTVSALA